MSIEQSESCIKQRRKRYWVESQLLRIFKHRIDWPDDSESEKSVFGRRDSSDVFSGHCRRSHSHTTRNPRNISASSASSAGSANFGTFLQRDSSVFVKYPEKEGSPFWGGPLEGYGWSQDRGWEAFDAIWGNEPAGMSFGGSDGSLALDPERMKSETFMWRSFGRSVVETSMVRNAPKRRLRSGSGGISYNEEAAISMFGFHRGSGVDAKRRSGILRIFKGGS